MHRQRDEVFVRALQAMRMGLLTPDAQALFASRCSGPLQTPHGIEPTVLGTHLAAVDRVNTRKLDELPTASCAFAAVDSGDSFNLNDSPFPSTVRLKTDAQVVCLWNHENLVNGSRGRVVGFSTVGLPLVLFMGIATVVEVQRVTWTHPTGDTTRNQLPLGLAWALTIHKSQGMVRLPPPRRIVLCRMLCFALNV